MKKVAKKKRGRPEGYRSSNPHGERLAVNVTVDQMVAYKKAAERSGANLSQWVRDVLDRTARRRSRPS